MKELINELNERGFIQDIKEMTVAGHTRQEIRIVGMPDDYRIIHVTDPNGSEFHTLRKDTMSNISPEEFVGSISNPDIRDFLSQNIEQLAYTD